MDCRGRVGEFFNRVGSRHPDQTTFAYDSRGEKPVICLVIDGEPIKYL